MRPLVARALGLAELRLEVAGGVVVRGAAGLPVRGRPRSGCAPSCWPAPPACTTRRPRRPSAVLLEVPLARLVEATAAVGRADRCLVVAARRRRRHLGDRRVVACCGVRAARSCSASCPSSVRRGRRALRLHGGRVARRAAAAARAAGDPRADRAARPGAGGADRRAAAVAVAGLVPGRGRRRGVRRRGPGRRVGAAARWRRAPRRCAVLARVLPGVDVDAVPADRRAAPRPVGCDPFGWRRLGVGADDRVLVTRTGRLTRVTDVVLHEKVQSVRLRQGPLQRRLGLASVHLDTTPGPVHAIARAPRRRRGPRPGRRRGGAGPAARGRSAGPDRWMTPSRAAAAAPTVAR